MLQAVPAVADGDKVDVQLPVPGQQGSPDQDVSEFTLNHGDGHG